MRTTFARDSIVRIRAPLTADPYGVSGAARDWSTAARTVLSGWNVQPETAPEIVAGRNSVVTRWVARGPSTADLVATDRVEWRGLTYEVDGEVMRWPSVSGELDHLQAALVRVRG